MDGETSATYGYWIPHEGLGANRLLVLILPVALVLGVESREPAGPTLRAPIAVAVGVLEVCSAS
jgi:hypothetical protein